MCIENLEICDIGKSIIDSGVNANDYLHLFKQTTTKTGLLLKLEG